MRTSIGAAACAAAFAGAAIAQPSTVTWQHVIDVAGRRGEIQDLVIAPNGDIIVSGFAQRAGPEVQGSSSDAWLARYAPDGAQRWSRIFGGEYRDEILDLKLANDGSILLTGLANFRFDGAVRSDAFVARYGASGDLVWSTLVHGDKRRIMLRRLTLSSNGSIIVAGEDTPDGSSGSRALVVSLDASGKTLWQFTPPDFVEGETPTIGALQFRNSAGKRYVSESARVNWIAGGQLEVEVMQNTIVSIDPARCFSVSLTTGDGGSCLSAPQDALPLQPAPAFTTTRGGLYEDDDVTIRKHDARGAVVWERTFPTAAGDGFNVVAATSDGGAVGAGYVIQGPKVERHNWDGLLMKVDGDGKEVWTRILGGSRRDELTSVAVLPDGSIVVAGYTGSQGAAEDWNPWLMRLNPEGQLEGSAFNELQNRQK